MTLSERLAAFAAQLSFEDVPSHVVSDIKNRILDTLSICIAARSLDAGLAARSVAMEWKGPREATLIGERTRIAAAGAALVNGTYAHSLDYDDTHLPSIVHPSATLVPTVLAQAEALGASGQDFLATLAVGYEVLIRLAMAQYDQRSKNSVFFERGFHATSIIGTLAATVACGRLRGLSTTELKNALGIACSMGAGLLEGNRMGGSVKRFHCGWAGHSALAAVSFAAHGLTAPDTALEGLFGFFPAFCGDRWDAAEVTSGLGERWDTPKIFFKPYPCNHFTHAVVDAALELRQRGLVPEDIQSVEIGTAGPSWRTIGDPIEQKRRPSTPYHAQFSAPFVFAAALVGGGGLGIAASDFTESTLHDSVRLGIAARTDVVVDEECTRIFPHQFPAVVRIRTRRGGQLETRIVHNRGGSERPLTHEELMTKASLNAGTKALEMARRIETLDHAGDLDQVIAVLSADHPRKRTSE